MVPLHLFLHSSSESVTPLPPADSSMAVLAHWGTPSHKNGSLSAPVDAQPKPRSSHPLMRGRVTNNFDARVTSFGMGVLTLSLRRNTSVGSCAPKGLRADTESDVLAAANDWASRNQVDQAYDYTLSTKDNYTLHDTSSEEWKPAQFGPYAETRRSLDSKYHGVYTKGRQAFQDKIIEAVVEPCLTQKNPWLIYTAGAMGAGKSRTIHWMWTQGHFPLDDIVHIDPDIFKAAMPEWKEYVRRDPASAGLFTRRESGYIVEISQVEAMRRKKNIWIDGSLRDGEWYESLFNTIREDYPCYKICIIHVTAKPDIILDRAKRRGEITGRMVPDEEVLDSIERVPLSVNRLLSLVDCYVEIENSGETPQLTRCLTKSSSIVDGSDEGDVEPRVGSDAWSQLKTKKFLWCDSE